MWIFNLEGFFSVVENRNDKTQVLVRARYKEDIMKIAGKLRFTSVFRTPSHDYPYRIFVPKQKWVEYIAESAAEIDYDNFKNAALVDASETRSAQYHDVWATMAGWNMTLPGNQFEEVLDEKEASVFGMRDGNYAEEQDRRTGVSHRRRWEDRL